MTETVHPSTCSPPVGLIGSALILPVAEVRELVPLVLPCDFEDPAHRVIWSAIGEVVARGELSDPVTVLQEIRAAGEITEANRLQIVGRSLVDAVERCPHPISGHLYARAVAEDAYRRKVEAHGTRCAQIAHTAPIGDIDANVREWVERLREARTRLVSLGSALAGDAR